MRALAALDRIGKDTDEVTVQERVRFARTKGVQISTLLSGAHFNPFVIVFLALAGGAPNSFTVEQLKGVTSIAGTKLAEIVAAGWASFEVMTPSEFEAVQARSKQIKQSIKSKGFAATFAQPVAAPAPKAQGKAKVLSPEAKLQADLRKVAKDMGFRLVKLSK